MTSKASAVDVAFIEFHRNDGSLVQLEPGGRFMHVGIRVGSQWLHAHPHEGVSLVNDLSEFGHNVFVLHNSSIPEPSPSQFEWWLGKPFDFKYSWDNLAATYCTRLVAELLGVEPLPMAFRELIWKDHYYKPVGELGLSPDDLFMILMHKGFSTQEKCEQNLVRAPQPG